MLAHCEVQGPGKMSLRNTQSIYDTFHTFSHCHYGQFENANEEVLFFYTSTLTFEKFSTADCWKRAGQLLPPSMRERKKRSVWKLCEQMQSYLYHLVGPQGS